MLVGKGDMARHNATVKVPVRWPLAGLSAAGLVALIAAPEASGDPAKAIAYGKHLSQECASCHRHDGVDNGIPSIIGWDAAAFRETLGYYKEGSRPNPVMVSVAQSLETDQIEALAAYYASLPKPARSR